MEEILIRDGYKTQSSLACPHCEKAFGQKSDLTVHIKRSLKEATYVYTIKSTG